MRSSSSAAAPVAPALPSFVVPLPALPAPRSVLPWESAGTNAAAGPAGASRASLGDDVSRAVESRIRDLKSRGGVCSSYGEVLERSYRSGRITIRPFMWRVGETLVSGEAKPNGEMTLAREIDPLNVGVRTVDDVVRTMEHEAAHIAFGVTNGVDVRTDHANDYVSACRG